MSKFKSIVGSYNIRDAIISIVVLWKFNDRTEMTQIHNALTYYIHMLYDDNIILNFSVDISGSKRYTN